MIMQGLEKKIEDDDKKILNTSELVKRTDYITNITQTDNKVPSITRLVTVAAFNTKATEIKS